MLSLRRPQGEVRRKFHFHSAIGVSRLQIAGAYPKTKQRKAEGWPGAGRNQVLPNLLPLPRRSSPKQGEPRANEMDHLIEIQGTA